MKRINPFPAVEAAFLRRMASFHAVPHCRGCILSDGTSDLLEPVELLDDEFAELPCRRCGCLMQAFPCPACGALDARNPAIPLLDERRQS